MTSSDTAPRQTAFAPLRRLPGWVWVMGGSAAVYAALCVMILRAADQAVIFAPSAAPLLQASGVIQVHVAGAVSTFFIGLVLLLARKGRMFHRTLGWTWVLTMATTAISSFLIHGLTDLPFSPIHALSAWTLIGLPMGLAAARRHNVESHRKHMTGMFLGGMMVAGLFTFLPGRLMWHLLFQVG